MTSHAPTQTAAPDCTANGFVHAIRRAAENGEKRLKSVVDDYEYDCSCWSAGPRKATELIGLRVRVECDFLLPVNAIPPGYEVKIDTAIGRGCWLSLAGTDDEDPEDVMRLAFEGQREIVSGIVLEGLIGRHAFKTLSGLGRLAKRYRASDYTYRAVNGGLMVSLVAELEAY